MKGRLILADGVKKRKDGKVDLIGAGIGTIGIDRTSSTRLSLGVAAQLHPEKGDSGDHVIRVLLEDTRGNRVGNKEAAVNLHKDPSTVRGFNMHIQAPKSGEYSFTLSIDGQEVDRYPLRLEEVEPVGN